MIRGWIARRDFKFQRQICAEDKRNEDYDFFNDPQSDFAFSENAIA